MEEGIQKNKAANSGDQRLLIYEGKHGVFLYLYM